MAKLIVLFCVTSMLFAQSLQRWHEASPIVWGSSHDGWQLAMFAEKQSFLSSEPLMIMLVARNLSPNTIKVSLPKSRLNKAEFIVKRVGQAQTTPLARRPPKDSADRLRQAGTGSAGVQVAPGGIVRPGLVDLHDIFDFSPGTYTVQAIFRFPGSNPEALTPVLSNEITVSVVSD
jgi:hypothetical protein